MLPALQAGDRDALRAIYEQYHAAVYWAAFAVVAVRQDAEDLVQETFITLWEKRHGLELVGESFLPWLVTTARYKALNRRRAQLRRDERSLDGGGEDPPSTEPSPEARAAARELGSRLETVMDALPELDQRIFRLCLLEDLTYKEAAYRLGVSHASVRNRLSRLKARLRGELRFLRGGQL